MAAVQECVVGGLCLRFPVEKHGISRLLLKDVIMDTLDVFGSQRRYCTTISVQCVAVRIAIHRIP